MPFAVAATAVVLAGCPDDTIKIGVVVPATGVDQSYGLAVQRGIEVAFEEIQASRDTSSSFTLLPIADSQSDPVKAREHLEALYDDGAIAAIGGITTDEVQEMMQVIDRYDRALLSPSASSPELTGASRNFFRIWPSDFTAANKMADFALDNLNLKTVVIVVERSYGKGIQRVFEEAFKEKGGEIMEVIEMTADMSGDLGGLVERIMTLKPDAVYLAAYEAGVGTMIKGLRAAAFEGKILTTSAFATSSSIANVGQDAEGVFLTQTFFETDSEYAHIKKFVNRYREKYGEDPDLYAAHGYDAMKVLVAALDGRPALSGEAHKGLREIIEFEGITGSIQFNDKGDVQKYPRVYVVGDDLALYDYTERVEKQKAELKRKKEELERKLELLQRQAEGISN
jgi:branched-chain amino acid transport system substrate-binding protein